MDPESATSANDLHCAFSFVTQRRRAGARTHVQRNLPGSMLRTFDCGHTMALQPACARSSEDSRA